MELFFCPQIVAWLLNLLVNALSAVRISLSANKQFGTRSQKAFIALNAQVRRPPHLLVLGDQQVLGMVKLLQARMQLSLKLWLTSQR